ISQKMNNNTKSGQQIQQNDEILKKEIENLKFVTDVPKLVKQFQVLENFSNHPYRHIIFNPNIDQNIFLQFLMLTYRGLVYSTKCLKGPSDKFIQQKQVELTPAKNPTNNILFLDLDETLIHSCRINENYNVQIKAFEDNNSQQEYLIQFRIRPYCMEFLQKISKYWDIYLFTASSTTYANAIVNYLDPHRQYINQVLTRKNCMETKNGFFVKDLRIVKGINIKKAIIVDNLAHSFGLQIDNGIPILEWHSDKNDVELKHLIGYLIEASKVDDVRVFNQQNYKLTELIKFKSDDLKLKDQKSQIINV
ncbi:NLI interacting factor-like phosphatase family protein, putative, partial [Ichthyophthirius multifiliis]